jgi:adenine/guanine/hypoxanthine permease
VVTGLLFLAAMFLTPLYSVIPIEAAAPALVVVGALMAGQVSEIDFGDLTVALPAFLTIVVMSFTYSIVNGLGSRFITWVVLQVVTGRAQGHPPLMWIVSVAFAVYFAVG